MPIYEYSHPETGKVIEVIQGMTDKHTFVDDQGVEWKRVFNLPNAAIDTSVNPFSEQEFVDYTAKKGMTAGEMMDLSGELSKKRENSKDNGIDPVKQKTVTEYEKKTGKAHPNKSGNKPRTL
ncbi:hypothetical protein CMI37_15285 [Candidatus Pacearchaeota archaeon]|jgi:hypothetical protein|nr:hypothetical protein [Candidatus Pacearchaeota archaeon]|tara:strand:+ start:1454 stop:1819 length:366 start_codon:yes stop_codon:yes gene_type:complete